MATEGRREIHREEKVKDRGGLLRWRLAFCIWNGKFMSRMRWLGVGVTAVTLLLIISSLALAQEPTPTVDRLAAPPTVPAPNQADEGAQLYWLYCQPCHGDQGQGLTDEWRAQFPAEESNCWQSGCHSEHGKDKPEFGFVLPTAVPPLTTDDSLPQYQNMGQFYYYVREQMPFELPGRLTDEEYLAITAHIAREHDIWDGTPLTEENVQQVQLRPAAEKSLAENPSATPQTINNDTLPNPESEVKPSSSLLALGGVGVIILATGGIWLWRRQE